MMNPPKTPRHCGLSFAARRLCWRNGLTSLKHESAIAGRVKKECTIDATTKQHLACENIQELRSFIVAELSFFVQFVVVRLLTFT
jgi:hypothetical protein